MKVDNEKNINSELSLKIEEITDVESVKRTKPDSPNLKVAGDTPVKRLTSTIIGCLKDWGYCRTLTVGEKSTWQVMKAVILANERLSDIGIKLYIDPDFMSPRPVIDDVEHTGADIKIIMVPKTD